MLRILTKMLAVQVSIVVNQQKVRFDRSRLCSGKLPWGSENYLNIYCVNHCINFF